MAAKICKKHKKEFYGLRCPICTAPPVLHHLDEDEVPFKVVDFAAAEEKIAALTTEADLDTQTPTSLLQIQKPHD